MTQKRKADLQRKLSMAPVAKPPSDLLDRIKSDIPEYLDAAADRQRLSRSVAFSVRVAASILLLVSSVFLTMQIVSRHGDLPVASPMAEFEREEKITAPQAATVAAAPPSPPPAASAAPAPAVVRVARLSDAAVDSREEKDAKEERPRMSDVRQRIAPSAASAAPVATIAEAKSIAADASEGGKAGAVVGGVVGGVTGGVDSNVEAQSVAAPAAPPPPPPPMEVAATAATEPSAARREANASLDQSAFMAPRKVASISSLGKRDLTLSTNPDEVGRLKQMLARGETPDGGVDVAAVVDHFAGRQDAASQVRLQVEASRAPLASSGTSVIRYTIDTPSSPITRADLTIALEKGVIASHRSIGRVLPAEGTLGGQSVTGLVELQLAPGTKPDQRVATIILRYSTGNQPRERAAQPVFARDLRREWDEASRRHKLATLGAVWAESLGKTQRPADLERTAEELAEESPDDPLAQELARAIASSRPRSSAPTGSGR